MKIRFILPLVLLTACASQPKPHVRAIPGTVLPSEGVESVRYSENIKAYPIGRYIDPNDTLVMHERHTNLRPVIFVQLADATPRSEVWRALHGAATLQSNCGKIVIAVSEDIDPASMDAVLWSLAYRTNPIPKICRCDWYIFI